MEGTGKGDTGGVEMHPEFLQMTLHDHQRDLDQRTRFEYTGQSFPEPQSENQEAVELRLCRVDDDPALERLAMLEGRPTPAGRYVIAEVDGTVVAAISLISGAVLADPFEPTAHLLPLLELRAAQLAPEARGSRGLPLWNTVRTWGRASA
jgi:hypothetical protein